MLFASLFFFVGIGLVVFLAVVPMAQLARSASWIECEALIDPASVKFEESVTDTEEGGTTRQVQASYTYTTPDGKTRSSDCVAFSVGSNNIGSWRERAYQKLTEMRRGKTVCYVNPNNMDEAVLLREVHEGDIIVASFFGSFFACAGLLIIIQAIHMYLLVAQRARDGEIVRPDSLPATRDVFIAAIPACLSLWSLFVFLIRMPDASAWIWLLLIPSVVPAVIAWRCYRMRGTFGDATLMPAGNIRVGGKLACDITLTNENPDAVFESHLECLRMETRGVGKRKSTTTTSLWKSPTVIPHIMPGDGTVSLRVAQDIPDGLPETGGTGSIAVEWVLTLRAQGRRFFSRITFHLDVLRAKSATVASKEAEGGPATESSLFEENGIRLNRMPSGGIEIVFPGKKPDVDYEMFAEKMAAFSALFFSFVFFAIGCFVVLNFFSNAGEGASDVPIVVVVFFAVFFGCPIFGGIFKGVSALRKIYRKYSAHVFTIDWKHGATLHTELGNTRKKIAELSDILNLTISNVNGRGEKTQALYAHTRKENAVLLTEQLRTPESADMIGEFITRAIHRSNV